MVKSLYHWVEEEIAITERDMPRMRNQQDRLYQTGYLSGLTHMQDVMKTAIITLEWLKHKHNTAMSRAHGNTAYNLDAPVLQYWIGYAEAYQFAMDR